MPVAHSKQWHRAPLALKSWKAALLAPSFAGTRVAPGSQSAPAIHGRLFKHLLTDLVSPCESRRLDHDLANRIHREHAAREHAARVVRLLPRMERVYEVEA